MSHDAWLEEGFSLAYCEFMNFVQSFQRSFIVVSMFFAMCLLFVYEAVLMFLGASGRMSWFLLPFCHAFLR